MRWTGGVCVSVCVGVHVWLASSDSLVWRLCSRFPSHHVAYVFLLTNPCIGGPDSDSLWLVSLWTPIHLDSVSSRPARRVRHIKGPAQPPDMDTDCIDGHRDGRLVARCIRYIGGLAVACSCPPAGPARPGPNCARLDSRPA